MSDYALSSGEKVSKQSMSFENQVNGLTEDPQLVPQVSHDFIDSSFLVVEKGMHAVKKLLKDQVSALSWTNIIKETQKSVGIRDKIEDKDADLADTEAYLRHPEFEGKISGLTRIGLLKNADTDKPIENSDASSTYTIVQLGLSNRRSNSESIQSPAQTSLNGLEVSGIDDEQNEKYYSRKVRITVPANAINLGECQFQYGERKQLKEKQFNQILAHDRQRIAELNKSKTDTDVEFYTHGVWTHSTLADTQSLILELSTGLPTVNIDWPAYPNTQNNPERPNVSIESYLHYKEDKASAKKAAAELAPGIDKIVGTVGAEHTILVGFSHGGRFDSRYLRHRVDLGLPKIQTLVLAHPDLPIAAPELDLQDSLNKSLLSAASKRSFVIGGQSDKLLFAVAFLPSEGGERLGSDSSRARRFLQEDQAVAITEYNRLDPTSSQHILNCSGIADLLNGNKQRSLMQFQSDYIDVSKVGRQHR